MKIAELRVPSLPFYAASLLLEPPLSFRENALCFYTSRSKSIARLNRPLPVRIYACRLPSFSLNNAPRGVIG